MWPKAVLINIFLFYSIIIPTVALPVHAQATLHDSVMIEGRSGSISNKDHLAVPHVSECGIFCDQSPSQLKLPGPPQSTFKAERAGHGRRGQTQGLAKQTPTPQAKTHKASTHQTGRITRNGYSRTGIFIVKAMLYSVMLCCVVEISLTVTHW
jgi:hypothetical protein